MSRVQDELRRLAQEERQRAWMHAKRLPVRVGDVATAFARQHPMWAMGAAAAIAMSIVSRRHRQSDSVGKAPSWPAALAAIGARMLPDILRFAGLTGPDPKPADKPQREHGLDPKSCDETEIQAAT